MSRTQFAIRHRTTRRWIATDLRQCLFGDTLHEAGAFRYEWMFQASHALMFCPEFAGAYEIVPVLPLEVSRDS